MARPLACLPSSRDLWLRGAAKAEEHRSHQVRPVQRDVERPRVEGANFDDQDVFQGTGQGGDNEAKKRCRPRSYNVAPALSAPGAISATPWGGKALWIVARGIIAPALNRPAAPRLPRIGPAGAGAPMPLPEPDSEPPATPAIATAMMTTNSGSVNPTDGLVNRSSDTVTR